MPRIGAGCKYGQQRLWFSSDAHGGNSLILDRSHEASAFSMTPGVGPVRLSGNSEGREGCEGHPAVAAASLLSAWCG
jgi:hypothetical protein